MKAAAALIILLAAIVGTVPHFTDCQSQGKCIQLPNGKTIPMKCHWTAQAETMVAVPLAVAGILLFRSPKDRSRSELGLLTIALGICAILIPTTVIGVCASNEMLCSAVMKPSLVASGILAAVIGGYFVFRDMQRGLLP